MAEDLVDSVTDTLLAAATATATFIAEAAATAATDEWLTNDNSSLPLGMDGSDVIPAPSSEGSYFVLDHQKQQGIPKRQRAKEYMRPLWLAGMGIYIASQLFGSPLALRYLRPDWVAPLGASSLVFNFLFAYWLVGTPVTQSDIRGTLFIVLGVILIVIFSSINHGLKQELTVDELSALWSRGSWLSYFFVLIFATWVVYLVGDLLHKVAKQRASFSPLPSPTMGRGSRPLPALNFFQRALAQWRGWESIVLGHLERLLQRTQDARVQWLEGIFFASCGGSLAGLCLVFTKAIVKIMWGDGHPLFHFSAIMTLILLIGTAVLQIVCLNSALRCADTVVVVPLFYAGYTVFGFINALIFYDQAGSYTRWVLVMVFVSIGVLIGGVILLSTKPEDSEPSDESNTDPAIRMRPGTSRPPLARSGAAMGASGARTLDDTRKPSEDHPQEVVWDLGEDSDDEDANANANDRLVKEAEERKEEPDSDEDEDEGRGVGGTKESRGERGGLLLQTDEDDMEDRISPRPPPRRLPSKVDEDEAETFGPWTSGR
ncbi:hypothetical protein CcaverHIS002_0402670 [Cutaneotrichosporon cavernicola]|uniref:DUF803-domain-containing protein n=1 Tax=Cutaneotrichosporon cavernicola TaxID=279322 RepID=A0AA48QVL6_9TREE|nr:uncharacterized protein CcaverHIS019_0402630 [Cutaneotrichosporon cavernicola]BEI83663.1 hypothetical protein CcaverHIS002_0402670 [Cutaneotrichosporon cavernicola]BEI91443.1 hypothetical protein CcaverHIS019_0402630 [Cutaneotrichosporon cavernicola]BEI99217.1 hypothetical protein CcaverHIS631_0402600 [Cutaneotrichosporon cavernicola]BEJ06994.1 hypothetical protein CcaverHIS641_0402630 [Cutaneotrichosporon cavernicola]